MRTSLQSIILLADVGFDFFLCSLPNIEFLFFFMGIYHNPLIMRIMLEFTNGTQRNRKRDFLRITEQELGESKEIIYIFKKGSPY